MGKLLLTPFRSLLIEAFFMSKRGENMTKKIKKISSLSIIVIIMGGTIGAGIFFKNKTLSQMAQGDFGMVMATWGVGILAMISLALALVEVSSAQKTDRGTLEWVKLFCPKWIYNSSSNYIKWIFIPITLFTMPLYTTNALEDAGLNLGTSEVWAILFAFGIFMWFMLINLFSLKYSEMSQWIFTLIQTIPLLAFPIYGFINAGAVESGTILNKDLEPYTGLTGASPWLATIAGISAIAFAYDGFYTAASLRNDMEKPSRIGIGLVGGVVGVSLVYLFLTIGMNVAGDGAAPGLAAFMSPQVYKMLNGLIAVGIMGVANSFAMSSPRQFADLAKHQEAPEIIWLQKKLFSKNYNPKLQRQRYLAAWWWIVLTTTAFFLILGPIGGYAYNLSSYGDEYAGAHIYSFADVMTNFTSLIIFVIIASAVLGALINRKTQKVKVNKSKMFLPFGILTVVINFAGGIYMIIESIVNMTGYNGADAQANIINFIIFMGILAISIVPAIFQTYKIKLFRRKKNKNLILN